MKLNKIVIMSVLSLSASIALSQESAKVDLSKVLNGIEKNCGLSNKEVESIIGWVTPAKGYAPSAANAPAYLKSAITKFDTKKTAGGVLYSAQLNASYKGFTLKSIEREVDPKTETSDITFLFEDKKNELAKKLGTAIKSINTEGATPTFLHEKSTGFIFCDLYI